MGRSVPKKVSVGVEGEVTNIQGSVSSVASAATVSIVSFTVPVDKVFFLSLVEFNGNNIADYEVFRDATKLARKCSYFGAPLYGEFFFDALRFIEGEKVELKVTNFRPEVGDFDGRILGRLDDE